MKLYKGKTPLFYKYFLSYLVIFLIPFITISFFFYHVSTKIIKDEIVQSNISKLEQVRDLTDTRMREMKSIVTQISLNNQMTPYMLTQPYESKQAIKELTTYSVNNSSIDGLFLYFDDHDYIYTSSGTATFDTYTGKSFGIHKHDIELLQQEIKETKDISTKKVQLSPSDGHAISYIFPISPGSSTPYGKVVFLIKESKYIQLTKHVLGDFYGNTYIFDNKEELITSSNNGGNVELMDIKELSFQDTNNVIHTKVNGEDYSFMQVKSDITGWSFTTAIPTSQFFGKLDTLQKNILFILFGIAILGIIAILTITIKQYNPIRNLMKLFNHDYLDKNNWRKRDEFTNIRESIHSMTERSEALHQRVKEQEPYVRDQVLLRLLNGNLKGKIDMDKLLQEVKIPFRSDRFFIIALSFHKKENHQTGEQYTKFLSLLDEIAYSNCIGYGVELIPGHTYGIIVGVNNDEANDEVNRKKFVQKVLEQIKPTEEMYSIGIGKMYRGIDKINRSFIEAKASLECAIINSSSSFVYFEDISKYEDDQLWFPLDNQVKLQQSLKQGDYIVAKETLQDILDYIKSKKAPIFMIKSMSYDVINSVLKTITEMNILYDVDQIKTLVQFQSLEDLSQKINHIMLKTCNEVKQRKENNRNTLCTQMMAYIEKEYMCYDFSLDNVANQFQLSPSYTSRFLKEQTGYTFTQLVWNLRIEKCKELLLCTSRPIKDIVTEIGYLDVANFTRKFKKEIGITPGQYRNSPIYSEQQKENMG